MGYAFLLGTVALTVAGQLAFKWRIDEAGDVPSGVAAQARFVLALALDPWVIAAMAAALVASITWGAALKYFDLSFAYPWMSLSFVLVLVFGALLFNEAVTPGKAIGVALICVGVFVGSRW